jgi:hypothetical protein
MSYLGMAIGSLAGLFVVYFGSDRISEHLTKKHGAPSAEVLLYLTLLTKVSSCLVLLVAISHANWIIDVWMGRRSKSSLVCP